MVKPNGYRQFNTVYIEILKKRAKSELAAAVALLLCCGDGDENSFRHLRLNQWVKQAIRCGNSNTESVYDSRDILFM